jgi:hypothetical protein
MLLSDCSARQHEATEEVEKAKLQLQELQVRFKGAMISRDKFLLAMQEQIRKHQIQLQSLQNILGDTLAVQLAHLSNRVTHKV